jgi:hypothetical protein
MCDLGKAFLRCVRKVCADLRSQKCYVRQASAPLRSEKCYVHNVFVHVGAPSVVNLNSGKCVLSLCM